MPKLYKGLFMTDVVRTTANPDEALELLIEGNKRFLSGEAQDIPADPKLRLELAKAQAPMAAYLSCSDSRVSPELLFGRGLGELFIVRNAGNTIDTVALGSIEFAVGPLGVPLVVVMGHQSCGAVAAAISVVQDNTIFPGSIGRMIEPIIPSVLKSDGSDEDALLENSIRANVSRQVQMLRNATDPILREPQDAGTLKVVGAYYNFNTGEVDFFDRP